jgi:hypothetical protein
MVDRHVLAVTSSASRLKDGWMADQRRLAIDPLFEHCHSMASVIRLQYTQLNIKHTSHLDQKSSHQPLNRAVMMIAWHCRRDTCSTDLFLIDQLNHVLILICPSSSSTM